MTQRDVPGATRGIVPLLEANGVRAYAGGVNTASLPPDVPRAFVWRDMPSGKEILAMVHPHGYGGIDVSDCVVVDGAGVVRREKIESGKQPNCLRVFPSQPAPLPFTPT
jgi:hypothetical protein